ncbi:MAG TPA: MBL fold metallo-hydrolase [Thermoplasmatales archaeon]|nr:MBL fold metallo-hydrolase [Thermoplasmatales archaeon]
MLVHRLLGFGFESNVYLIEDERNAVVDTGTGFYTERLLDEISRYVEVKSIDYIILTHEHFDHCGGAADLKNTTGAEICMHEMAARTLEEGEQWSAMFFDAVQKATEVERKLREGDKIILGEAELRILHTPGHSPGSICLYDEKSRTLFSGDVVFAGGGIGRTDFYGGNAEQLVKSIKRLVELNVENLYPGHGDFVMGEGKAHIKMAERMSMYLL